MKADDAAEKFLELFPALYRRFSRRLSLDEYQLTSKSVAILQHLAATGPLTVGEAARHMSRSQAAMSEMIARLVNRGVLDRIPDERDRRRILIWLTEEGHEMLRKSQRVLSRRRLVSAMTEMRAPDREQLITSIEALLNARPKEQDNASD